MSRTNQEYRSERIMQMDDKKKIAAPIALAAVRRGRIPNIVAHTVKH